MNWIVGIDATNIRSGGGVTHLLELLRAAQPAALGIARIVVWSNWTTLQALVDQPWLTKRSPSALNGSLIQRMLWQRFRLSQSAHDEGCDVLFVPGGSYVGNFHPVVAMSQNLLPFDWRELRRYGCSVLTIKWLLLRFAQSRSFRQANGVIFLTQYARDAVMEVIGKLNGKSCTIPHGLNPRFCAAPKTQNAISQYNDEHPFRVLYVSIIDHYKHQSQVVEAVSVLRRQGFPIALDLVGPAYAPALGQLNNTINRVDKGRHWVQYHGAVAYEILHHHYAQADLGLFASSCENMPIILMETMASGLPIACSNRGPMPEVLGAAGVYFDPEQPRDIARALRKLINSPKLRAELAQASYARAQQFSWLRCADQTFSFLCDAAKGR